ncbi:MAG: zinc ribbon domain-containing protein [Anaerolineae bacterium]
MPLYEYECESCGVRFERRQHMEDEPVKECPECGGGVHRLIQPVGIIFKGSGFYVTDNRSKSPTSTPGTVKESVDTSKSDSSASSPSDSASADSSSTD